MQYLTEVKRAKTFVGEKVELKLLARNTSDNNWVAINTDQVVIVPDLNMVKDIKDGQLALADLVGNNDVKSVQDASRRLVQTLQNFGRLQEKFRQGEEEINQWKQSLTFQTQELQRREIEVEDRERELERLEGRKEELESQVDQFERERSELEKMRAEVAKMRDENESREKQYTSRATALSNDQAQELQQLVRQLAGSFFNVEGVRAKIMTCLDTIYTRQETLNGYWRDVDAQRPKVGQLQQELDGARRHLEQIEQEWQQIQTVLTEAQLEVKLKKEALDRQESIAQVLRTAFQSQEEVAQGAAGALSQLTGPGQLLPPEEVKRLQEISLEDLEVVIANSQSDLEKSVKFVNGQEEELASLEGEIAELANRIDQANEFEKIDLENQKEMTDEDYEMLEQTIEGQRRSLKEKEFVLTQQRQILEKRLGTGSADPTDLFRPIVQELNTISHQTKEALDKLQQQIDKTRSSFQQQETIINDLKLSQQRKMQEVRSAEEQLFGRMTLLAEAQSSLTTLERLLRPIQDIIDVVRPNMEAARDELAQADSAQAAQPILQQLEQKITALISDEPNW